MTAFDELKNITERYINGDIGENELLSYVEPLLRKSSREQSWEKQVTRIVNDIERYLFTLNEPDRTRSITRTLIEAQGLLSNLA